MEEIAFGRYRLVALLGEGGMGKVYRAHDTMMDRDVAIKVLLPELAAEPGYEERFKRESRTAARLTEPHVIPVYEAGEIDGRLFLSMPVIEGIDVQELLRRDGPMSPQRAVHVIEQLAAALDAAHAAGLVHRDIKPSNALLAGRDFVYLIDFGIAHDSSGTKLTKTGMLVGTMAYMAPERFSAGTADASSDVYALTCVLHECLTGSHPYPGDSMEQQIAGHLTADPPKPCALRTGVPAGFDQVIATGMAKKAEDRYRTAGELAGAARAALGTVAGPPDDQTRPDETVRIDPPDPTQDATLLTLAGTQVAPAPATPDRRGLVIGLLAGVAAIGGVVALVMMQAGPPSSHSRTPTSTTRTSTKAIAPVVPTSSVRASVLVTYSVTGFKAAGDSVTIRYTDTDGGRRTVVNVTLPWTLTLMAPSSSTGSSLQAISTSKSSRLNCSITASGGRVLSSNKNNSAQVSC